MSFKLWNFSSTCSNNCPKHLTKCILNSIKGHNQKLARCSTSSRKETENIPHSGTENAKDVSGPYPSAYHPKDVERKWYEYWEQCGFFKPEFYLKNKTKDDAQNCFTMVLPPPNVTGNLHLGHTMTVSIQDALCRWNRMKGKTVVWYPGYDHGGISTQAVVEKKLLKERKITKHQLGKEQFLTEVLNWKEKTQETIEEQLKKIGSSLDFDRCTFTMDAHTSGAVVKAFIRLFEENLIYRKEKMVNWSCAIRSVISDIEVDYLEVPANSKLRVPGLTDPIDVGLMDYFYYQLYDSDERLLIATTRLETMLGDSALAVHPNDKRYAKFIGHFVKHPFMDTKLPIIGDESIQKEFGTGVMKVTPAHDFKDYELGEKHNLPMNNIFLDDGTVVTKIKTFGGKHRFEVRKLIRERLSELGLYLERKSHAMSIPVCSRTGDVVEPRLKSQWYLNCGTMAEEAVKAVDEGRLKFVPEYHKKLWNEWFRNFRDWCISRQLWWGHRIPVYRINHPLLPATTEVWVAASSNEEAVQKGQKKLHLDNDDEVTATQDEDVLDTWFSSALFPLTALGWPTKVDDMEKFYPLSMMETGYDIIFFWVARMVMLGQHLTGKLPFNEVLLHGMVCDSHGRKMTKSLGNIVDPTDIIYGISLESLCERAEESFKQGNLSPEELKLALSSYRRTYPTGIPECGTDALRFSLLFHDVQNQRINMDVKGIRICRNFCNKIWQGIRLFTKAIENCSSKKELVPFLPGDIDVTEMHEMDQWILSRLSRIVSNCNQGFETYNFHMAAFAVRQFWVQNFCDIYLEYIKSILISGDENSRLVVCRVMLTCIEVFLRTLSPIMPYLSEELYQRLTHLTNIQCLPSISIAPYPQSEQYSSWRNTVLEADVNTVSELVNIARSLKTQHGATKLRPKVTIAVDNENTLSALDKFSSVIATLARLNSVTFHQTRGQGLFEHHPQDSWEFQVHEHGITVIMEMDGHVETRKSSDDKVNDIREELKKLSKLVSDSGYRKKAPPSVQQKDLAKKASLESELQKLLTQYGKGETYVKEDPGVSEKRNS